MTTTTVLPISTYPSQVRTPRFPSSVLTGLTAKAGDAKKKKKKKKHKKKKMEQSEPPRIGLSKLFVDGGYPEGEIQVYKNECALSCSQAILPP
jgi:hypothetical protein